jgi:hypothetical protein
MSRCPGLGRGVPGLRGRGTVGDWGHAEPEFGNYFNTLSLVSGVAGSVWLYNGVDNQAGDMAEYGRDQRRRRRTLTSTGFVVLMVGSLAFRIGVIAAAAVLVGLVVLVYVGRFLAGLARPGSGDEGGYVTRPAREMIHLAQLRFSPNELSEMCGIDFDESSEDFDISYGAVVELPSGTQSLPLRYEHSPIPGTSVMVDEGRGLKVLISEFLAAGRLDETDIIWRPFD